MPEGILCVGFCCIDVHALDVHSDPLNVSSIRYAENVHISLGGDACNQAFNLCRLGHPASLAYPCGEGVLSEIVSQYLHAQGIHCFPLNVGQNFDMPVSIVSVYEQGEHHFTSTDFRKMASIPAKAEFPWSEFRLISLGSLGYPPLKQPAFAHELLWQARQRHLLTVADTMLAQNESAEPYRDIFPLLDYFLPSEEEANILSGENSLEDVADFFLDAGVQHLVIKLGRRGCYYASKERRFLSPAQEIRSTVNTTGAGDAFVSGFIHALLNGKKEEAACAAGHQLAARVIMLEGAHLSGKSDADSRNN